MRIVLKDDIPVYQSARRLAFSENQDVNKQIDEWLEQGIGYGAVLLQEAEDGKLHHVQYMSQKTTPAEEKYSSYELEVLVVVNALKKFRTYLLGNHFKIITGCSAFQNTMDKKDLVTRITRWALLLEEYDYEIVHRSGQRMQHSLAIKTHFCHCGDESILDILDILDESILCDNPSWGDYLFAYQRELEV
ncbi:transposon Ty3-I Gag-Pol polyprotein [Trichonephila clavipes]|nr:transposon Ty3-I Gag-Pol polyprotein [Trichonephila clavipes]